MKKIYSFLSKFTHDFSYSFLLNTVNLIIKTSFVFILPKLIGVEDFGYWQLYFLYTFFIAFGHLGLVDGIYLKNGGKYYKSLNFKVLRSQFLILLELGIVWAFLLSFYSQYFVSDSNKTYILMVIALDLLLSLPRTLISVIFQMTGMIKEYSYSLMSESISSFLMIIFMLFSGVRDYQYLILADCGARGISLCVSLHNAPGFIGKQFMGFIESMKEAISNISVGVFLLLSNMVGLVVIASVRFAVEDNWGIVAFSKVSLAFSISSVAITATGAASVVLFPLLKRLSKDNLEQTFSALSLLLMALLMTAFSLYYPGVTLLGWWLPKYGESFYYLTIILPMTLFDSNFSVIGSNFLKVMRKERSLLSINILAVLFTWGCVLVVLYGKLPLELLLGGIVLQSFIKMGMTIRILNQSFPKVRYLILYIAVIIAGLFYISNLLIGNWAGSGVYLVGCLFLLWVLRGKIKQSIVLLKSST
ncbi:hypothetical protein [Acidaminococcus fermentans]|uniref:lipopolysaccharide biosynthesis protein n=1 Tax=Acidaminococcus fermentans TaxID=905 RepID=UPI00242AB658|nr:hypothetical protein [Acidaminococcus fermentans]